MACGSSHSTSQEAAGGPTRIEAGSGEVTPINDLQDLSWQQLQDVTFEDRYYEDIEEYLLFPAFGDSVKALAGQPVKIAGYVLPVEPGRYVLSANPFSSCFFCGGAGPESVMELELRDTTLLFYTDEWRTFQGRLQLNDSNVDKLNYILEEAEVF
ncbi:MAG: DUF3299 domain-containing protein [Bacteroidetes bacterium]|nr:MAG: DUF3299 domain-containing protein [Bacteroidota bacterium]